MELKKKIIATFNLTFLEFVWNSEFRSHNSDFFFSELQDLNSEFWLFHKYEFTSQNSKFTSHNFDFMHSFIQQWIKKVTFSHKKVTFSHKNLTFFSQLQNFLLRIARKSQNCEINSCIYLSFFFILWQKLASIRASSQIHRKKRMHMQVPKSLSVKPDAGRTVKTGWTLEWSGLSQRQWSTEAVISLSASV